MYKSPSKKFSLFSSLKFFYLNSYFKLTICLSAETFSIFYEKMGGENFEMEND